MSKEASNKRILLFSVILIAILVSILGLWLFKQVHRPTLKNGTMLQHPVVLKQFNLIDKNGKPFTNANLKGHWSLIFFGFTNCPSMCPATLAQMNKAYKKLKTERSGTKLPNVYFISVDPKRDTSKKIKAYLAKFNPAFNGATGSKESIDSLTKNLGVAYAKATKSNDKNYDINHSGMILVINPNGEWIGVLSAPHDGETIARDFVGIQINYGHNRNAHFSNYKGKWVIVNYWATWCKPCLKEMPALNDLYKNNKDKIVVLGVSYDKLSNKEIKAVAKKLSIQYPMLSTFPINKFGVKHLSVLPVTFIINPKGQLVKTLKGPQTEAQFKQAIGAE